MVWIQAVRHDRRAYDFAFLSSTGVFPQRHRHAGHSARQAGQPVGERRQNVYRKAHVAAGGDEFHRLAFFHRQAARLGRG